MLDSVPFAKESPFLEPMRKTFFEMAKSGILKKIWDKYTYSPPNVQCEEKKVNNQTSSCYYQCPDNVYNIFSVSESTGL